MAHTCAQYFNTAAKLHKIFDICKKNGFFCEKCRIIFDLTNKTLETADFICHRIEGYAVCAGDMTFIGVVLPRREDEQTTGIDRIKEMDRGFVVLSEAVVGKVDDGVLFEDEIIEYVALVRADKWRDHYGAISCCKDTTVLIITQALIIAVFGLFNHRATDMNRHKAVLIEQLDIAYRVVGSAIYLHVMLNLKEAGVELFGGEALRVEFDVLHHCVQLSATGHRSDEGYFRKDRKVLFVNPNNIRAN